MTIPLPSPMPNHNIPDPKDILAPGAKRKSVPSARARESHVEGSVRKRPRPSDTSVGTAPNAATTPSIRGSRVQQKGGRAIMMSEEEDDDDDDLQQQGVSEAITDRRSITGCHRLGLTNERPSLDHRAPPQPPPVSDASKDQPYTSQVPQRPSQTALGKRRWENTPSENTPSDETHESPDADEEQLSMWQSALDCFKLTKMNW